MPASPRLCVSFVYSGGKGRAVVYHPKPLSTAERLNDLEEKLIEEHNTPDLHIYSWRRMEPEE